MRTGFTRDGPTHLPTPIYKRTKWKIYKNIDRVPWHNSLQSLYKHHDTPFLGLGYCTAAATSAPSSPISSNSISAEPSLYHHGVMQPYVFDNYYYHSPFYFPELIHYCKILLELLLLVQTFDVFVHIGNSYYPRSFCCSILINIG